MTISANRRSFIRNVGLVGAVAVGLISATSLANAAKVKIGLSVPTLDNPFWVNAVNFAKHAADGLGVDLTIVASEGKEEKQLADVQSMISNGVQALVITPISTANAAGLIKLANKAKLPAMMVDRYPGFEPDNKDAPYLGFIGPNDVSAGRDIAKALLAAGSKKIVGIGGVPGSSVADGREKGLREAAGAALVQYVAAGESEDKGYEAMQNLLAAHPKGTIDGVWCYNDGLCLGAYRAIKQAGRDNEIKIASMDLVPQVLELIEKKTNYTFSTGGHWLQLGFGVIMAYDKVNGRDPLTKIARLDLLGVNGDNFATFKKQFIDNPPPYNVKDFSLTYNAKATSQQFPLATK